MIGSLGTPYFLQNSTTGTLWIPSGVVLEGFVLNSNNQIVLTSIPAQSWDASGNYLGCVVLSGLPTGQTNPDHLNFQTANADKVREYMLFTQQILPGV